MWQPITRPEMLLKRDSILGQLCIFFSFFFFQLCIFAYKDIRQGRGWAGGMSNDILTMTLFVKETCFTANIL